ncbi:hypothetical protein LTR49_028718, partial [Elasticomyces elasticus]
MREALRTLQDALSNVLPAYMVPSVFAPFATLPVNTSGKLDRRALRERLQAFGNKDLKSLALTESGGGLPSTETERLLQDLWASALGTSTAHVGVGDSFFQLGGDSVTAMRLVGQARGAGIHLSVADVFRHPRLRNLAHALESSGAAVEAEGEDPDRFTLWPASTGDAREKTVGREEELADLALQCGVLVDQIDDVYPCTPLQEGLMAITARQPSAYVAQRAFALDGSVDLARFKAAWERLAESLAILRTRVVPTAASGSLQVVVGEAVRWLSATSLDVYLAEDRRTPLTYGGQLCRVAVIEEEDAVRSPAHSQRYFVWTAHHSICDGWSVSQMLVRLARLYGGRSVEPSVPVTRFIQYLVQQDKHEVESFWRQELEGASKARFPAISHVSYVPQPTRRIQRHMARSRRPGVVTAATVLRAAWATLVAIYTAADEAVINVALSGRNAAVTGIADLIAPTVTSLPLRVAVPQDQPVRHFLESLQRQAVEMMPFEHTGFQNIRRMVPGLGADFDAGHMLTIQPSTERDMALATTEIGMRAVDGGDLVHSYALNLECMLDADDSGIGLDVWFDEAVMSASSVAMMLAQFEGLFHQLSSCNEDEDGGDLGGAERTLADLELLSEEDVAKIRAWNGSAPARSER